MEKRKDDGNLLGGVLDLLYKSISHSRDERNSVNLIDIGAHGITQVGDKGELRVEYKGKTFTFKCLDTTPTLGFKPDRRREWTIHGL